MKATGRTRALSSLRAWWPELAAAAILTATGCAPAHGTLFLAVFCACMIGIGWAMGHRHRTLPLTRQVREIWETTRRIEDRGLGEPGPRDADGPLARVHPIRRR